MEALTPAELHKQLKVVTRSHIKSLNCLLAAPKDDPPQHVKVNMDRIKPDAEILSVKLPLLVDMCLQDPIGGEELVWDMEKELSSWLWLSRSFADEPDFVEFHPLVPSYLFLIKSTIRPVRKNLRKKIGFLGRGPYSAPTPHVGMTTVSAGTVNFVQYNAPGNSPKECFPDADPGRHTDQKPKEQEPEGEAPSMKQPPADFRLPDYLEILPLKAEEKALFLRFLWFISTHPLPFKLRMYALLLFKLDLILEEHFKEKKDLYPILNKLCGSLSESYQRFLL